MDRLDLGRSRLFWKIYFAFTGLFLAVALLFCLVVLSKTKSTLEKEILKGLENTLDLVVAASKSAFLIGPFDTITEPLRSFAEKSQTGIVLMKEGGEVLFASKGQVKPFMWDKPEIKASLSSGIGLDRRKSGGEFYVYLARAVIENGKVLGAVRVSRTAPAAHFEYVSLKRTLYFALFVAFCLALFCGYYVAKKVAEPAAKMLYLAEALRDGRYESKIKTGSKDEMGRLGEVLNNLGDDLSKKWQDLDRLESLRRDFVANVSHELKTPLTSINGYVETLKAGAMDDPSYNKKFLDKIARNTERLSILVLDILNLAKIEAHEGYRERYPLSYHSIITSMLTIHGDAISQKGLDVRVIHESGDFMVLGEKEALTQIVDNLLTNAIKYSAEKGKIFLITRKKEPFGYLEVKDTGIGIPREHLARIFERFYRVDKARSVGGTGLGLSIVKHLVSSLGGQVSVGSQVGEGSSFVVTLRLS